MQSSFGGEKSADMREGRAGNLRRFYFSLTAGNYTSNCDHKGYVREGFNHHLVYAWRRAVYTAKTHFNYYVQRKMFNVAGPPSSPHCFSHVALNFSKKHANACCCWGNGKQRFSARNL